MTARPDQPDHSAPDGISASAVGEYVYCARAYGLRQVIDGVPDPAAALRRVQGLPANWRSAATDQLFDRQHRRAAALAAGTRAHHRVDRRVRTARLLVLVGLLLIVVALTLLLLPLVPTAP